MAGVIKFVMCTLIHTDIHHPLYLTRLSIVPDIPNSFGLGGSRVPWGAVIWRKPGSWDKQ